MPKKLRAKVANGVLVPLDELDLEEGAEITLSIDDKPELSLEERIEKMKSAAGAWKGKHDPEELKRMIYASRIAGSREVSDE